MIKELRNKAAEKHKVAKGILDKVEAEKRTELSAEERTQYDAVMVEIDSIQSDIDRRAKFDAYEARMNAPANSRVAPGDLGNSLGVPEKDLRRYSILRAIDLKAEGKELDGLEGELHQEICRRTGKQTHGILVPMEVQGQRRALDTTTGTGGVNSQVLYSDFISILRNKLVIQALGARYMGGLVGNLSIPRQNGAASAYWFTEGSAPNASNQTLDSVALSPKSVGATTSITRKFAKQTSMDAEAFVREDLASILALAIDAAAIRGSGIGAEPEGILAMSGIGSVTAGGVALTFPKVVALETALATANADIGSLAYLTNPHVRGALKTTVENNNAGANYIWRGDNTVNGYKAMATNAVPSQIGAGGSEDDGSYSAMIFGNWNDLIIAQWGGLEVLVDPYTGGVPGSLKISVAQDVDIVVRHKASFARCMDIA